jgi:hypothetical protein
MGRVFGDIEQHNPSDQHNPLTTAAPSRGYGDHWVSSLTVAGSPASPNQMDVLVDAVATRGLSSPCLYAQPRFMEARQ